MIRVLTPYYNCPGFIVDCINSIKAQTEVDFVCYLINDVCTDNTPQIAEKAVDNDPRFIHIHRKEKYYQSKNYYDIIHNYCDDNDIVITVDGDDLLPPRTFKRINNYYQRDPNIWVAYGSYKYEDGRPGISVAMSPEECASPRTSQWKASHIRTFKAWVFKQIKEEDFYDNHGKWLTMTGDMAMMFPIIELSGYRHLTYMPDINYIYRGADNPNSDHVTNRPLQFALEQYIRSKPPYKCMEG